MFRGMQNIYNNFVDNLALNIFERLDPRQREMAEATAYFKGKQRKPLIVKPNQADDNIILNFIALAVWRSVARLLKGGVRFKLPDGAEAQSEYLKSIWDANKQEILLQKLALKAAVLKTGYIKMIPEGRKDLYTGQPITRLLALDPKQMTIITDPQDHEDVDRYEIKYKIKDTGYLEVTRQAQDADLIEYAGEMEAGETWLVEYYESSPLDGGKWRWVKTIPWPYDFPPIIHYQNLPDPDSCYGKPDIDDEEPQDKTNFIASNIAKIVRLQSHKMRYSVGLSDAIALPANPENMVNVPIGGSINQLDANADLTASRAFWLDLRQSIFDLAREVDMSSVADKLGALTNFALRVLYSDALDKNDSKRQLLGDMLLELNRRLLVIGGYEGEASRPGEIVWADPLPSDILSDMQVDQLAIDMNIVDRKTVYERHQSRYGADWETIQANLAEEKQTGANLGAFLLQNFNKGA